MMKRVLVAYSERCTGCRLCELVCSLVHEGECNPSKSRIHINRWELEGVDIPMFCMQCEDAPCAQVCPVEAMPRVPETGALVIDEELCFGCKLCASACPFGAIVLRPEGKPVKCDLCQGDPECVKFCETKAIEYVRPDRFALSKMRVAVKKFP